MFSGDLSSNLPATLDDSRFLHPKLEPCVSCSSQRRMRFLRSTSSTISGKLFSIISKPLLPTIISASLTNTKPVFLMPCLFQFLRDLMKPIFRFFYVFHLRNSKASSSPINFSLDPLPFFH